MPRVPSIVLLLLTAGLCVDETLDEDLAKGQIVDQVPCTSAAIPQTYALYLPSAYSKERRWPVLYLFDARQHGAMAAEPEWRTRVRKHYRVDRIIGEDVPWGPFTPLTVLRRRE